MPQATRQKVQKNPVTVIIQKEESNSYKVITNVADLTRVVTFPLDHEVDTVDLSNNPIKVMSLVWWEVDKSTFLIIPSR